MTKIYTVIGKSFDKVDGGLFWEKQYCFSTYEIAESFLSDWVEDIIGLPLKEVQDGQQIFDGNDDFIKVTVGEGCVRLSDGYGEFTEIRILEEDLDPVYQPHSRG